MTRVLFPALFLLMLAPAFPDAKTLDMHVIDTEGGKALLLVSPSSQSMLIDGGLPGFNGRDVMRVEEAAKAAGVKRLDFLVVTHYDLEVSARNDGSFTVTNARSNTSKSFAR